MLCACQGGFGAALCGAGRADGMRATDGRSLTGRRSAGAVTTGLATMGFFLTAGPLTTDFLAAGLGAFAALRLAGLPAAFLDLPLPFAMTVPVASTTRGDFHTNRRADSSLL